MKLGEKMEEKESKKIFITILKILGIFFLCYLICLIIIIQISYLIFGLENISSYWAILIFLLPTIIAGIITFFLFKNKKGYAIFGNTKWLKFSFSLIIIFAFIGSLKKELEIDLTYAKELLGFEWTMFSLTIALFLAWYLIVEKYLKNEPIEDETGRNRIENIIKRHSFYINSFSYLLNGLLLFINFLGISFITGLIWVNQEISLFIQSCLFFDFFLTINSMQMIFNDIIIPIIVKLFLTRKYKMTDEKITQEIVVGLMEEKLAQNNDKIVKEKNDGQT